MVRGLSTDWMFQKGPRLRIFLIGYGGLAVGGGSRGVSVFPPQTGTKVLWTLTRGVAHADVMECLQEKRGRPSHRGRAESIDRSSRAADRRCVATRVAVAFTWEEYTMKKASAPIRFAASQLGEARHVGAFFHSEKEEYRVLLPFIMRTHPMVIVVGMLQENPFFVSPEEFLGELRARRARQTTARSIAV
jgi:hypothetical protein